jgi:hypothetical protein
VKTFLVKVPEGMLELWKRAAEKRNVPLAVLIRESVNKEIASDR